MIRSIVVVEPMCRGFEHVQYNSPLLYSLSLAFPNSAVMFLADPTHGDLVRATLATEAPGVSFQWRTIHLPDRDLAPYRRLEHERGLVREVFRVARETSAELILFASTTDTGLVAVKSLLWGSRNDIPVIMILHSVLLGLEDRSRPFTRWRGISLALKMPHPRHLRLIVPGQPVQSYLANHFPGVARQTAPLDHPSFWGERFLPQTIPGRPVRFGFFGVSAVPGFDIVVRIARALRSEGSKAEFSMVGHLNHPDDASRDYSAVPDAGTGLLPVREYTDRARRLTYALWTTRSHRSGLVTSSAFVDALSFVKPLIYLSNPVIDEYAGMIGDIGYRCEDEQQMTGVVRSLAADWPEERYRAQCAAILAGRRLFEPQVVAESLRTIVDDARRSL